MAAGEGEDVSEEHAQMLLDAGAGAQAAAGAKRKVCLLKQCLHRGLRRTTHCLNLFTLQWPAATGNLGCSSDGRQASIVPKSMQVGSAQLAHLPPPGVPQPDGMDEHISLTELVTGGEVCPGPGTRHWVTHDNVRLRGAGFLTSQPNARSWWSV